MRICGYKSTNHFTNFRQIYLHFPSPHINYSWAECDEDDPWTMWLLYAMFTSIYYVNMNCIAHILLLCNKTFYINILCHLLWFSFVKNIYNMYVMSLGTYCSDNICALIMSQWSSEIHVLYYTYLTTA